MHKSLLAGSVLALAVGVTACDEGLTEINRNPNEPETVAPEYILADAQVQALGGDLGTNGVWFGLYLNDIWPQHLAQIQYNDEDKYVLRPNIVRGVWNHLYSAPLANLKVLKDRAAENNAPNQGAIAEIMSQYIFQVMTDHWGPIPYSEALQGAAVTTPKFDSQEEVYNGMLAALSAANGQITGGSAGSMGQGDLIYAGNVGKWKKLGNSLRMRMAMRIVDRNPTKAKAEFEAAMTAGGFTGNDDNAQLKWGTAINAQNAHYDIMFNQDRQDFVISETIVDTLKSLSDPRLKVYAEPAVSDGEYRGLRNGLEPAEYDPERIFADFSKIGTAFVSATSPTVMMTYSELLFLRAEAATRGWNAGGTAAELYRQAITASMQQHGIGAAAIAAYLAQPRVAMPVGASPEQMREKIWLQKWIALFMNGPEAYAEVRRTDTPRLALAEDAAEDSYPVRVTYPDTEQQLNKANYEAAVATLGADELDRRVWWDVR